MSARAIFKVKRPFVWSLVCSGLSLLFIEIGVLLFRQGLRRAGFLFALAGLMFLVLEVVVFLPTLVRNALRSTGIAFLFRITTSGFLYILLILLISIAAVNTGNNLLYILLAFMIAAISVSGVVSRTSLTRLALSVDYQDAIFAGEYTTYRLSLRNAKKWLPTFSIGVEGFLENQTRRAMSGRPEGEAHGKEPPADAPVMRASAYFPYLPAGGRDDQVFQVRFPERGLYQIASIDVVTSFPFGFFRKGRKIPVSGELVVFPALLEKGDLYARLERQFDTLPLLRKGLGSELYTLREYVPGEDVRHMHWKATARAQRYIIKEFALESLSAFVFLMDEATLADPAEGWEKYERAVSFLATLALELQEKGKRIQVLLSHTRRVPPESRHDLAGLFENLAVSYLRPASSDSAAHPFNGTAFQDLLALEAPGSLVLCSMQPPDYFYRLSPYLDNYLDMNQL